MRFHFSFLTKKSPDTTFIILFILFLQGCDNAQRLEINRLNNDARFGYSLTIDTLASTAAVGAFQESTEEDGLGAVYIYSTGNQAWSIKQRIISPNPSLEKFGQSIALSGRYLAIGAPEADQPNASDSGSVYLFRNTGEQWAHIQTLNSPGLQESSEGFGTSVALDRNFLVIGAISREQGIHIDAGAAFVYQISGSNASLIDSLNTDSPATFENFGKSITISGGTIAISALRRDSARLPGSGSVFIFKNRSGSFLQTQTLSSSDPARNDFFGTGLDLFRYNNSKLKLVVGAPGINVSGQENAGAGYVFDAPRRGNFKQTQKLTASNAGSQHLFGKDVAIWDDKIVIGASGENSNTQGAGAVYLYKLEKSTWNEIDKLTLSNAQENMRMGTSVDIILDTIFAGAPQSTIGDIQNTGTVEIFREFPTGTLSESLTLTASGRKGFTNFGKHLTASGNKLMVSSSESGEIFSQDPDGYALEQLLTSSTGSNIRATTINGNSAIIFSANDPGTNPGSVAIDIYTQSGSQWLQNTTLTPDLNSSASPAENANSAVLDMDANTLVLGTRRWNGGDGRVFIYERNAGVWSESLVLTSPVADENFDRNFGNHVALDGNWLAISEVPSSGIPDPTKPQSGAVHIYEKISDTFTPTQLLEEPVPNDLDGYGKGLAIHNDMLATFTSSTSTLRVYRRIGKNYTQTWSTTLVDGSCLGDTSLYINDNLLAVGEACASYEGLAEAGQVRLFDRQEDDTYTVRDTIRPDSPIENLHFGFKIDVEDNKLFVSTRSINLEQVYIFDL